MCAPIVPDDLVAALRAGSPRLALRISVTDRCQLRCAYCLPPQGVKLLAPESILSFEQILRFVRALQSGFGLRQVRLTGGEPLVRRGIVDLVRMLADTGVPDLSLTTNGQLLPQMAADLRLAGLHRINVSLDSLDPAAYRHITRGGDLGRTLDGIREALRVGLRPVKLNMVVMRGLNDHEVADVARFGLRLGCEVRYLELMPIGCARAMFDRHFVPAADIKASMETAFDLVPLVHDVRRTARDFLASDAAGLRGRIGFISAVSEPFCSGCDRLRLTSRGELISCVGSSCALNVSHLLAADSPEALDDLRQLVGRELRRKTTRAAFASERPMATVGG